MRRSFYDLMAKCNLDSVYLPRSGGKSNSGKVVLTVDSQLAEVAIHDSSLQEGERVHLYEKQCRGPKVPLCRNEKIGSAVVNKIISDGLSEIRWESGSPLKNGLVVQRDSDFKSTPQLQQ